MRTKLNLDYRSCENCSNTYKPTCRKQRFCCEKCSRTHALSPHAGRLPHGTIGAIGELEVAADLLSKGYQVFRALSPCCSCDLAVIKNGRLTRVEVTTGYISNCGTLTYPTKVADKFDILAIKLRSEIRYIPPLDEIII